MAIKRHKHYMFGKRIMERLLNGEDIRFSEQRPKIQEAILGMEWCELIERIGDRLVIKAKLCKEI